MEGTGLKFGPLYVKNQNGAYEYNSIYGKVQIAREIYCDNGLSEPANFPLFEDSAFVVPKILNENFVKIPYQPMSMRAMVSSPYKVEFSVLKSNGSDVVLPVSSISNSAYPAYNFPGIFFQDKNFIREGNIANKYNNTYLLSNFASQGNTTQYWDTETQPDGYYILKIKAYDNLRNQSKTMPYKEENIFVSVDNRKPNIVTLVATGNNIVKYSAFWNYSAQNETISTTLIKSDIFLLNNEITLIVHSSEPLAELFLKCDFTNNANVAMQATDNLNFTYTIQANSVRREQILNIEFTGKDYSNNSLLALKDLKSSYILPKRIGENSWSEGAISGADNCHKLNIQFINVPESLPSIQSAIDFVKTSGLQNITVYVQPGTYRENINFKGLRNFKLTGDEQNPEVRLLTASAKEQALPSLPEKIQQQFFRASPFKTPILSTTKQSGKALE